MLEVHDCSNERKFRAEMNGLEEISKSVDIL